MPVLSIALEALTNILNEMTGDALLLCTKGMVVDSPVHSDILKLASPIFRDALELETQKKEFPTLQVQPLVSLLDFRDAS